LQSVDGNRIRVLGADFDLSGLVLIPSDLAFEVGRSAYVVASKVDGVMVATGLYLSDEWANPGSSTVYVQGIVEEFRVNAARVRINGLEIDTTQLGDLTLSPGDEIGFSGVQPLPGGVILGTEDYGARR
jgi:hypothetical protein